MEDSQIESIPEPDWTGVCFKDVLFLSRVGLNQHTALDYFSLSQFYDNTCNNENLKMQTRITGTPFDLERLSSMTGIEYVLSHFQEPYLYVIKKQYRKSAIKVVPKVMYYIIDGTIYQSPSAHNIFSTRMMQCVYQIRESFKEIAQYADFSTLSGYTWEWNEKEKVSGASLQGPSTIVSSRKQISEQKKLDKAIISVMQKYPPPTLLPNELPLLPSVTPIPSPSFEQQTNNTNTSTTTTTTTNTTLLSVAPTPTQNAELASSSSSTKRSRSSNSAENSKKKSKKITV